MCKCALENWMYLCKHPLTVHPMHLCHVGSWTRMSLGLLFRFSWMKVFLRYRMWMSPRENSQEYEWKILYENKYRYIYLNSEAVQTIMWVIQWWISVHGDDSKCNSLMTKTYWHPHNWYWNGFINQYCYVHQNRCWCLKLGLRTHKTQG